MIENAGSQTARTARNFMSHCDLFSRIPGGAPLLTVLATVMMVGVMLTASMGNAWAKYASIIINAQTGQVLWEKNADDRNYPASLTKMMTLYMLFDALDKGKVKMSSMMPVSAHAAGQSPSKLGLRPGASIRVEDAIKALVTKSANDVAVVISEYLGDSEPAFARLMTSQAQRLGMRQTTFKNASGLPNLEQMSSARDMATLSMALQRNFPQYYHYFSLRAFEYNGTVIPTHNRVLLNYPGADGLKTGFIAASGFNLAASATRNGVRLVGVVFGGKTASWRDQHMMSLLDDGFRSASGMARVGTAVPDDEPQVARRGAANKVAASAPAPASVPARTAAPAPAPQVTKPAALAKANTGDAAGQSALSGTLKNSWGIQVGAFSSLNIAQQQAQAAASHIRSQSKGAQPAITSAQSGKTTVYRARVLGLSSEQNAKSACGTLRSKEKTCVVVRPGTTETAYLP